MAAYNKTLGKFHLMNIPPAPRGIPQIEVTFDIDANGIVNVSAKDRGTGQEQKITITGTTALSDEEVDRMVNDAESHADEDKKKKEEAEVRNTADSLVYGTEKTLVDLGEKVPEDTKSDVEAAIADVKKALEGDDADAIKTATQSLQEKSYKLAEIVYQQVSEEQGAEGEAGPEGDEEVADYEVVDEDK
jgi:molecular chaperone DnaK